MKINKETWWIVYENWDVFSPDTERTHPSGKWICKKKWRKLKFSDNWTWYMITNRKWKIYLLHRIIYCTYYDLDYYWDFTVWHYNDIASDNKLENLYYIEWKNNYQSKKENRDYRTLSYKLWELYKRNKNFKNMCNLFFGSFGNDTINGLKS